MATHKRHDARQTLAQNLRSAVIKRSVVIGGRKTSVSLEDAFWGNLKEIALSRHMSLTDIVAHIDGQRDRGNLSSTIRLFVLEHARAQWDRAANVGAAPPGELGGVHRY
jgi:predicted DNA-binding ribbon-helix-helix protein